MNITDIWAKINQGKGARQQIQTNLAKNKDLLEKAEIKKTAIENAQALIQQTAKETQEQLRYHIEDIVNTALDTCFEGNYDFKVDFVIKRGRTEAELYLTKDGERIDPMTASGGGLVDIVSFALRLSAWALSKNDPAIILDEPFKFLSSNLRPLAGEILKTLSEKLGLQIIMVTHDNDMIDVADRVFKNTQKNGKSILQ